jgi:hypothetical protein
MAAPLHWLRRNRSAAVARKPLTRHPAQAGIHLGTSEKVVIPAQAGIHLGTSEKIVIPAQAGIHLGTSEKVVIPAQAGIHLDLSLLKSKQNGFPLDQLRC